MKNRIKRIGIVGLGLIGGSIAMALKVNGYYIVGITKTNETLSNAKNAKAIDEGYLELTEKALNDIDLIILSTPLTQIDHYIEQVSKIVKKEIILTDVGSTKLEICNFARKVLPQNITFIGGHPMAGSEKAGFLSAQITLFKNCAWLLTPLNKDDKDDKDDKTQKALLVLKTIVRQIGAKPIITTPEKHDLAVALVSHLPLLVSIGLCQIVQSLDDPELKHLTSLIASSGFRDTTRIGGGNPEMNSNLLTSNYFQLAELLPKYYKELQKLINLAKENPKLLQESLSKINEWRAKLYNFEGKNNLLIKESEFITTS